MYPKSGISPHPVHKAWAMSVCRSIVETPMGFGKFNIDKIPESDFLLIESLYCAPFAKKYKKLHPECTIISLIADTSFWEKKYGLARKLYYKLYLKSVDGFIAVSERIAKDAEKMTGRPVFVVRPFLVNKHNIKKGRFGKNLLFIGNAAEEKGFGNAIKAMGKLSDFDLYLVGTCHKKIPKKQRENVHIECVVPSLEKYLKICSYYIHPADFDPSPVTVWEAMHAGLIPIISKNVGQSDLFTGKLKILVLENNTPETITKKIVELDGLSERKKQSLRKLCKKLVSKYTKENSIREFRKKFHMLVQEIG